MAILYFLEYIILCYNVKSNHKKNRQFGGRKWKRRVKRKQKQQLSNRLLKTHFLLFRDMKRKDMPTLSRHVFGGGCFRSRAVCTVAYLWYSAELVISTFIMSRSWIQVLCVKRGKEKLDGWTERAIRIVFIIWRLVPWLGALIELEMSASTGCAGGGTELFFLPFYDGKRNLIERGRKRLKMIITNIHPVTKWV